MKNQSQNDTEWIAWNGKTTDTGRFASVIQKKSTLTTSGSLIKKSEIEKMRAQALEKGTKAEATETTSNTQRIDVCFDSLWRQCT